MDAGRCGCIFRGMARIYHLRINSNIMKSQEQLESEIAILESNIRVIDKQMEYLLDKANTDKMLWKELIEVKRAAIGRITSRQSENHS